MIRSLIVFELCQYPILVDVAPSVIKFCQNVFLDKPLFWLVKQSFFSQFCGGERAEEVIPLIKQLETRNIGAILDFSSESDIDNSAISDEEKALHVVNVIKECIQVAKTSEGNFAAVKLTGIGYTVLLIVFNFI